jgi:NAD(P)-dependent dehydrogenase (short-subunit alcohol dehydrogenase family)
MASKFAGKVGVITGGSTGMGFATARRFVDEGMDHVFITGRRKDVLDAAVAEIGRNITGLQGDVANLADLNRLYETVRRQNRKIDVLFANAGVSQVKPFDAVDEQFFDLHFDANVKGLFFTVQKALPLLGHGSSVIFNTSAMIHIGLPSTTLYVATKAALRSIVRVMASEFAHRGIRVNTVSPGSIVTPLHGHSSLPPEARDQAVAVILQRTPAGRFGNADEVAKAVLFLASDDSSYVTGEELVVSGGWSAV